MKDIERGYIVVAESGGLLLGTGTIIETSIRRVFINPEYQHQGIGKISPTNWREKPNAAGRAKTGPVRLQ